MTQTTLEPWRRPRPCLNCRMVRKKCDIGSTALGCSRCVAASIPCIFNYVDQETRKSESDTYVHQNLINNHWRYSSATVLASQPFIDRTIQSDNTVWTSKTSHKIEPVIHVLITAFEGVLERLVDGSLLVQVLIQLPLSGAFLVQLGRTSKHLFQIVLATPAFARIHFKHQFALSNHNHNHKNEFDFLDSIGLVYEPFSTLPFSYQVALHGQVLLADEWPGVHSIDLDKDMSNNKMWFRRFRLARPLETTTALLACSWFDITAQNQRLFRWSCRAGYVSSVLLLLKDPRTDPATDENYAIRCSAESGELEVVQILLKDPRVNPSGKKNYAIRAAATFGHLEITRLLLADPRVDPSASGDAAVILAARNGYANVVELLLADDRVDPGANMDEAIRDAAMNGHVECILALQKSSKCNPAVHFNTPLRNACVKKHPDAVLALLSDSRVSPAQQVYRIVRMAVSMDRLDVVQALIGDARCDLSEFDNIAVNYAYRRRSWDICNALLGDERVRHKLGAQEYEEMHKRCERKLNGGGEDEDSDSETDSEEDEEEL
ncbi:hypothetical protein HDU79_011187 [Rhizoclosmatium sp. JEL0117]|nr:hypothetical protein HDU79_011187 [Rhizoclosmatium sp. JEL0117]